MVIVVFMPGAGYLPLKGVQYSLSAWDGYKLAGIAEAWYVLVYLIAAIVVAACALIILIISRVGGGGRKTVRNLSIMASVSALVAVGTVVWGVVDSIPGLTDYYGFLFAKWFVEYFGYGFYIHAIASVLGLISSIVMLAGTWSEPKAVLRRIVSSPLHLLKKR